MKNIDLIICDHVGDKWHLIVSSISVNEWIVLLDKIQENRFSLRRSVWEILYIYLLKNIYSSVWLTDSSKHKDYIMDLIGIFGDLARADDYCKNSPLNRMNKNDDSFQNFYSNYTSLLHNLRLAIDSSGLNSSNLPN